MQKNNIDMVFALVDKFPEARKSKVLKLLSGSLGEQYFTAPASTNEGYHSSYPGGLVAHSLNVVKNLYSIQKSFCPGQYSNDIISFVGLFHDLGKIGNGQEERYLPNDNEYQKSNYGKIYNINQNMPWISPPEASLFILQQHSIELSHDEYMAIKLSMGQYDDSNKEYRYKEPILALLLHWAKRISCEQEKKSSL